MRTELVNPGTLPEISQEFELADPGIYLRRTADVLAQLSVSAIEMIVDRLFQAYTENRSVYVFGNGGSAALASHAACDLGKGTVTNGNKFFRIISLTDNVPLITAWANDARYEDIFAAQLRPLIQPGDIAFAISGSGNSPNVLKALCSSREAGGFNVGLSGFQGGEMKALCDLCVIVPSENMQQIEDSHLCLVHAIFLAICNSIRKADSVLTRYAGVQ